MKLRYDMTRCHGSNGYDQKCDRRNQCLRYLTMDTDPKDRVYSQAAHLCFSLNKNSHYFYYIPLDEDE